MVAPMFDPRCSFLRTPGEKLPLDASFNFDTGTTAMHYWPPRRGVDRPPSNLTLFILGNPGVLDYYTPFVELLRESIPDGHAILCTSHVGGDMRIAGPAEPLGLMENLDTKVECAAALRDSLSAWAAETRAPIPKLSVMGHSIGAWLCVEVMKRVRIDAAYLLFPTLGWIANSWNGWKLWPIFHRPIRPLLPLLANVASYAVPFLPISLPETSVKFISSPETVRHVLHLAGSEMMHVRRPDLEWYHSHKTKPAGQGVYGVWSAGNLDGWVGADGPLVRECIGQSRWKELDGVPHAFCLDEKYWTQVASVVAEWIPNT